MSRIGIIDQICLRMRPRHLPEAGTLDTATPDLRVKHDDLLPFLPVRLVRQA